MTPADEIWRYQLAMPGARAGVVADASAAPDVLLPVQTHSLNVLVIGAEGPIPALDDTDALVSLRAGLAIGVRTADCVPVLLSAPDIRAVAAIHAGWKGSLGGIVTAAVERLTSMGAHPGRISAAFGPAICGACYEVGAELAEAFTAAGFGAAVAGRHVDLAMVNRLRLERAGVPAGNIIPSPHCTREDSRFPSWRRCATPLRLVTWITLI